MIISFSQLGRHGRLGNQLFQVASTMGIAEQVGGQAAFPEWGYEQYFESEIPHGRMQNRRVKEAAFQYHRWAIEGDCDLLGYMQSEKYFSPGWRLKLREEFVEKCKAGMPGLFERPVICVHVRRKDYVDNPNYHQLTPNWYISALLEHFPNWREYNILFLSDDIEYCRTHYECMPNAFFSKGRRDIEDLALGSACDHFIISNSTFGWWCAWMGENAVDGRRLTEGGGPSSRPSPLNPLTGALRRGEGAHCKVVCSGVLTKGGLAGLDTSDFYPERWIRHERESYKIPLRDVTFTIPVRYDHADRRQNAELGVCLLQMAFETNIMMMEQGGNKFEFMKEWVRYEKFDGKEFHRTRMLNQMAEMAETPYIANWDCDVIIPPMQILMAAEQLRGGADMVFPYDGRFGRMPRMTWFKPIEKALDIGIVGATPFKNRHHGHNSVGGAVMFNKESFILGGMENEHMISFGPEDCERHDRFKMLGYRIARTGGSLFHMDHWVGVNSSRQNPHFKANHAEIEKIRGMSAEELRGYVRSWEWRQPYTGNYYKDISEGAVRSARVVMEFFTTKTRRHEDSSVKHEGHEGHQGGKRREERGMSVIDVGGGLGEWNDGNEDYWCIDYRMDPDRLLIPAERYIECNLEKEFAELGRRFDLCLCLEVGEHLPEARAEGLVEMLCRMSDRVLFSAAIPFQGGRDHVNEQWQSWWAELFAKQGFGAAEVQPDIRGNAEVELWYRQNMVLYERGGKGEVRDFVLPEYYVEIVKGRA